MKVPVIFTILAGGGLGRQHASALTSLWSPIGLDNLLQCPLWLSNHYSPLQHECNQTSSEVPFPNPAASADTAAFFEKGGGTVEWLIAGREGTGPHYLHSQHSQQAFAALCLTEISLQLLCKQHSPTNPWVLVWEGSSPVQSATCTALHPNCAVTAQALLK